MRAWLLAVLLGTTALPALAQTPGTHGLFDNGAGANPGIGGGTVTAAQIQALVGVANGIAGLDANSLLPTVNLPVVPIAKIPVGSGGVAAYGDSRIAGAVQSSQVGAAGGVAALDSNKLLPVASLPTVPVANLPVGTTASSVAAGNDSRIVGALPASDTGLATAESKAGTALQSGLPVSVTASATLTASQCGETLVDQAAAAITLTVPASGALPLGCTIGVFQASSYATTIAFASGMGGVYSGTANVTGGLGLGLTLKVLTSSATGVTANGGLLR